MQLFYFERAGKTKKKGAAAETEKKPKSKIQKFQPEFRRFF
jgi:hypothetical protein